MTRPNLGSVGSGSYLPGDLRPTSPVYRGTSEEERIDCSVLLTIPLLLLQSPS